ncbi:MAG: DNA-processing protein DprA [Actinomycetota bacterium]
MSSLPEEAFIAGLARLPGVGPRRLAGLLDIGPPALVWDQVASGARAVTAVAGRPDRADVWRQTARDLDVSRSWAELRASGVGVLWRRGSGFPSVLREDPEPPELLFTSGDAGCLAPQRVAIVGTRQCTRYGHDVAYELAAQLASAGVTVVSGLARGIDAAAHHGALDGGGAPPVAVVGTAIDTPYPRENAGLWRRVAETGLVCSEGPPGVPTERWRFPARNRIIAGLSDVVVVVESASGGGSLYTAAQAVDRGRTLLAVPGPIRSAVSLGTNRLLADGAHPVCEVSDVLEILGLVAPVPVDRLVEPALSALAAGVRDAIGWQPATLDDIVGSGDLDIADAGAGLEELVAAGVVARRGGWYERVHRIRPQSGSYDP